MTAGSKELGIQLKEGLEFSVDLSQTWEWDKGVEDSVSVAFSDTINVEPGQAIESSITVSKGTVTVPYTCTAIATFEDGTQATYPDFHGIFYGVRYYDVACNITIKTGDKSRTETLNGQVQHSVSS
jgi:hypothetical protein